ncbi:hypothetical protein BV898_18434 [Hypsibius exemplaris]|uniref:G-protein coupled receptors family 1 profile domain-containing protein n=1 Tax=Hypsibius exemplaris TaxID=2072580 RepID=A0A9X6NP61_HYPEX|nr:hypothetical protein BV898_18434 [Hypsibius exemplaris]
MAHTGNLTQNFEASLNLTARQNIFFQHYFVHFMLYLVIGSCLCLVGLVSSVACFIAVLTFPPLKRSTNHLVANLVVINIVLSATVYPVTIVSIIHRQYAELPVKFCDWTVYTFFVLNSLIWQESLVAVNRFVAIIYPHRYSAFSGKKGVACTIISGYAIPFCLSLYPLTAHAPVYVSSPPFGSCRYDPRGKGLYAAFNSVLGSYVPMALTGVCYFIIFASSFIKRHRTVTVQLPALGPPSTQARRFRVAVMLCVSFLWSLLGYLPQPVITAFYKDLYTRYPATFFLARYASLMGVAGSTIIYGFLNRDYRKGMCAVLFCRVRFIGQTVHAVRYHRGPAEAAS